MAEKEVLTANTRDGLRDFNVSHTGESSIVYEPPDELTPDELRRLITLARDVKAGRKALVLVQEGVKGSRLFIKAYDKAA